MGLRATSDTTTVSRRECFRRQYWQLGVSENRGPQYSTKNSRILVGGTPTIVGSLLECPQNKMPSWQQGEARASVVLGFRGSSRSTTQIQVLQRCLKGSPPNARCLWLYEMTPTTTASGMRILHYRTAELLEPLKTKV